MLHTKFHENRPAGSGEGFYHIWARWPSWSCDQDHVNKFSFPCNLKDFIQNLVQNGPVFFSEKI